MNTSQSPQSAGRLRFCLRLARAILLLAGVDVTSAAQIAPTVSFQSSVSGTVNAMAVSSSDGKVVLAGAFTQIVTSKLTGGAVTSSSITACRNVIRLLADGEVDSAFIARIAGGTDRPVNCLALQSDGRILMGGAFSSVGGLAHWRIARLNSDGSVDGSFNPVADAPVHSIAVQTDNRILLGGAFLTLNGASHRYLRRLLASGAVDTAFEPLADGAVQAIAIQSGSNIVVGGAFFNLNGVSRYHLGRLTASGTLDSAFNPGVDTSGGTASTVNCLIAQASGKLLVGGAFSSLGTCVRRNIGLLGSNGTPDSSFDPEANGPVQCMAVQTDGKILIGGKFDTVGSTLRPNFCRLKGDGSVDTAFNPRANATVHALAVQTDGTILAGGGFTKFAGLTYNAPGRVSPTVLARTNASLSSLRLDVPVPDPQTGALTPSFNTASTSYSVSTTRHTLGVKPVSSDTNATIQVRVNGGPFQTVVSGTASTALALVTGSNLIEVKTTADDGFTAQTYAIVATRTLSADATLSALGLDGGTLRPTFVASGTHYALEIWASGSTASGSPIYVMPTAGNAYASVTVQIDGGASRGIVSGTGGPLLLKQGINTISLLVTAEDRSVTRTYTLVTSSSVPASNDADLSSLAVNAGTLAPEFTSSGTNYGLIVTGSTISLTPALDNANATVAVRVNSGTAQAMTSGRLNGPLGLLSGSNRVAVVVTAEGGSTKTYSLNVFRVAAPVGMQPNLGASSVTLNSSVDGLVAASGSSVFEYGVTLQYGASVPALSSTSSAASVSASLSGFDTLPEYQVWHYRLKSLLGNGVYYGPDHTFSFSWPTTTPVAIASDAVPAIPGAIFRTFGVPGIDNRGDVAFQAVISGTGVTAANNSVLWIESDPSSSLLARTGDPTPGVTGGVFSGFDDPAIDSQGAVAFLGSMAVGQGNVTAANSKGIWANTSGSLALLAQAQTTLQVPGFADAQFSSFSNLALSDSGGPIFQANLVPGLAGVTAANAKGVWEANAGGQLGTALRVGEHDVIGENNGKMLRAVLGPLPKTPYGGGVWIQTAASGDWQSVVTPDSQTPTADPDWQNVLGPVPTVPTSCYRWIVIADGRFEAVTDSQGNFTNVGFMFGPLPAAAAGTSLWLATVGNRTWKWVSGQGAVRPTVASPWQIVLGPLPAPSAGTVHWVVADLAGHVQLIDRPAGQIAPPSVSSFTAFAGTPETVGQARSFNGSGDLMLATVFNDKTSRIIHVTPALARTVARSAGNAAAGVWRGTFTEFFNPAVNDSNHLAFRANVTGYGVTKANESGIWADFGRWRVLVARAGAAAAGVPGGLFASFNDPLYNNADQVAFVGQLRVGSGGVTAQTATGVWATGTNGVLRLVTRMRQADAPGYSAGVQFYGIDRIALLDTGGVALLATVTGNVAATDNSGIWATDATGELQLIVRKGGGLMVDGAARTITGLALLNGSRETMGQTRGFNDQGEIVYRAAFSDGTQGIFQAPLP